MRVRVVLIWHCAPEAFGLAPLLSKTFGRVDALDGRLPAAHRLVLKQHLANRSA